MASFEVDKSSIKDCREVDQPDVAHPLDSAYTSSTVGPVQIDAEAKDPHEEDRSMRETAMLFDEEEKKRLSFLDLPPEVRNKIYHQYVDLISWTRLGNVRVLFRPALAAVCKQVRAELLPVLYGKKTFFLLVHTDSPEQWSDSIRKIISPLKADTNSPPEFSFLRHVSALSLMLKADKRCMPPVEIKIEMTNHNGLLGTGYAGYNEYDPKFIGLDDSASRWYNLKDKVRVGRRRFDCTTQLALQAEFDRAARRLRCILAEMEAILGFKMSSTTRDHRTALDVIRIVASECPQLAKSVFIRDDTEPRRSFRHREKISKRMMAVVGNPLYVVRDWKL